MGIAERPYYRAIFSKHSLEVNLPARISKLCGIQISQDDGYPERLCRPCSDKFYVLEKNLGEFRERALESYRMYTRKRSTDIQQSPQTPTVEHSRPSAKRSSRARCLFPESGYTFKHILEFNMILFF